MGNRKFRSKPITERNKHYDLVHISLKTHSEYEWVFCLLSILIIWYTIHTITNVLPMKLFSKQRLLATGISFFVLLFAAMPLLTQAQAIEQPKNRNYGLSTEFSNVGVGTSSNLEGTIAAIINIVLGFLGIIAVVIIIFAGFKWMTAGGNEEQVKSARQMILQAIAGLVIVFSAWIIAAFVISRLGQATGV